MKQNGFAPIIILPVVVLLLIGILIVLWPGKPSVLSILPTPSPKPVQVVSPNPDLTATWKTYKSEAFGLEIRYPKEYGYFDNGATPATASAAPVLGRISFTDSNKNTFDLITYSGADFPDKDLAKIPLTSGHCGSQSADKTLSSGVFRDGSLVYKEVAQVDKSGRNLTDFCFFSPQGNLVVLRNNSGSSEIAMKLMLSTVKFKPL